MIEDMFFLNIIEFYLKFWLISLFLRWIISFLPGKISDVIRFVGNLIRYPIKRFFYWVYGVSVIETDFEKSVFKTEELRDFDCRITSNILAPLFIQSYIGSFIYYWAQYSYEENYLWTSIILFVLAFSVILMAAPDYHECEEILKVSVKSIFKWAGKLIILSLPVYFIIHFLVGNEALAQGLFIISLLIPFYHHSIGEKEEPIMKSKKAKVLEVDPFGE